MTPVSADPAAACSQLHDTNGANGFNCTNEEGDGHTTGVLIFRGGIEIRNGGVQFVHVPSLKALLFKQGRGFEARRIRREIRVFPAGGLLN